MEIIFMEIISPDIDVKHDLCNGCTRHKKDVMITLIVDAQERFVDIFLTNEEANDLKQQLDNTIRLNLEGRNDLILEK